MKVIDFISSLTEPSQTWSNIFLNFEKDKNSVKTATFQTAALLIKWLANNGQILRRFYVLYVHSVCSIEDLEQYVSGEMHISTKATIILSLIPGNAYAKFIVYIAERDMQIHPNQIRIRSDRILFHDLEV